MATAEVWRKRVAAWRTSGQTAAEYSKQHGLTLSALQRWSHRLRRDESSTVRLARVERVATVSPESAAQVRSGVVIELDGARVRVERGADAATVAMVLVALGAGGRR